MKKHTKNNANDYTSYHRPLEKVHRQRRLLFRVSLYHVLVPCVPQLHDTA
jgi:hypothetical protein